MIYPYRCDSCDNDFEVIKRVADIDLPEYCDKCGMESFRGIGRPNLMAVNDWTESYNPAFGCVVKNKAHQREILRKFSDKGQNFEEIGNESVDKLHAHYDKQREETRKQRWRDADRELY